MRQRRSRMRGLYERFWRRVDVREPDDCWEWTGSKSSNGYGGIKVSGQDQYAHRVSWMLFHGSIPKGIHVLHRCDNPGCVNPNHLFLGTPADNAADRDAKGRQAKGERMGTAKLTPDKVLAIRESPLRQRELARMYGVDQSQISHIKHRESWAWLT